MTRRLLESGANVNVYSSLHGTPLHAACNYATDEKMIELLVQHGADVNKKDDKGETPLMLLLSRDEARGMARQVEALLESTSKLETTANDIKNLISLRGDYSSACSILGRLLEFGSQFNPRPMSFSWESRSDSLMS
jgi:ankyrin repeat protein